MAWHQMAQRLTLKLVVLVQENLCATVAQALQQYDAVASPTRTRVVQNSYEVHRSMSSQQPLPPAYAMRQNNALAEHQNYHLGRTVSQQQRELMHQQAVIEQQAQQELLVFDQQRSTTPRLPISARSSGPGFVG